MYFSALRRWVNSSASSNAEIAPAPTAAEALFLEGLKFATGEGVALDYGQAARCYAEAAGRGHSRAQLSLATMYQRGQGVEHDHTKALAWLTSAARFGNAEAQYRLGVQQHLACRAARPGAAVETRIEALKWVKISASQGCRGAESACEFVALDMSIEEVAESGRRVAAFKPETTLEP